MRSCLTLIVTLFLTGPAHASDLDGLWLPKEELPSFEMAQGERLSTFCGELAKKEAPKSALKISNGRVEACGFENGQNTCRLLSQVSEQGSLQGQCKGRMTLDGPVNLEVSMDCKQQTWRNQQTVQVDEAEYAKYGRAVLQCKTVAMVNPWGQ